MPVSKLIALKAEVLWILEAQSHLVWDERERERKKATQSLPRFPRVVECGGRLENADLPYDAKHPILLPKDHPFTTLIIKWAHNRVLHNSTRETLTEVRSRFWIVRGRALVKWIIHCCVLCRKLEVLPYK